MQQLTGNSPCTSTHILLFWVCMLLFCFMCVISFSFSLYLSLSLVISLSFPLLLSHCLFLFFYFPVISPFFSSALLCEPIFKINVLYLHLLFFLENSSIEYFKQRNLLLCWSHNDQCLFAARTVEVLAKLSCVKGKFFQIMPWISFRNSLVSLFFTSALSRFLLTTQLVFAVFSVLWLLSCNERQYFTIDVKRRAWLFTWASSVIDNPIKENWDKRCLHRQFHEYGRVKIAFLDFL